MSRKRLWSEFMVFTACLLAFFAALSAARSARAADDSAVVAVENLELSLSVGENRTISARGVKSFSEGAPGVVEVRLTPEANEFVVVGQKPGSTTLLLIMNNKKQLLYSITVFARSMSAVESELGQLLTGNTGIRIRRVGPRIFIEGGVSNDQELERIKHIAGLYPGQVESLVVVGGVAADRKHNIQLDVYFVQFERTRGYRVGVSWPSRIGPLQSSISYDLVAGQYASGTASIVNQALLGLDMAAANGWAKVLKHSTVITANGAKASFSSGGEENFQIVNNLSSGIHALTFGTNVDVLPRFDPGTGELEIRVDAKMSELTQSVSSATNLPGRNTTDLGTLVNLKLGQGLVLSGIQSKVRRHSVGGIPLLSEIPLLGVLFGSHDDQMQEVDGAILLVPSVIEAIPKQNEQLLRELLAAYENAPSDEPLKPVRDMQDAMRRGQPSTQTQPTKSAGATP